MEKKYKKLSVSHSAGSYDIHIGQGILGDAKNYMDISKKVCIVTDSGVPTEHSKAILDQFKNAKIITIPQGEENKNIDTYSYICKEMLTFGMQRSDAIIAVGGGVIGDMSGFAAATYMRGIDFYNIPTTLLSMVDSSIGGKTAIDFMGVKNILGAFYQPKAVVIDTEVLKTLDERQYRQGLSEVLKMAATHDESLFAKMEGEIWKNDEIGMIASALKIKRAVVEADEREAGMRKLLNFGHTFGHGIEALGGLYHGECVALGMIPMIAASERKRLVDILKKIGLPTVFTGDIDKASEFMKNDKKGAGDLTDAVFVDTIGCARIERVSFSYITELARKTFEVTI